MSGSLRKSYQTKSTRFATPNRASLRVRATTTSQTVNRPELGCRPNDRPNGHTEHGPKEDFDGRIAINQPEDGRNKNAATLPAPMATVSPGAIAPIPCENWHQKENLRPPQ